MRVLRKSGCFSSSSRSSRCASARRSADESPKRANTYGRTWSGLTSPWRSMTPSRLAAAARIRGPCALGAVSKRSCSTRGRCICSTPPTTDDSLSWSPCTLRFVADPPPNSKAAASSAEAAEAAASGTLSPSLLSSGAKRTARPCLVSLVGEGGGEAVARWPESLSSICSRARPDSTRNSSASRMRRQLTSASRRRPGKAPGPSTRPTTPSWSALSMSLGVPMSMAHKPRRALVATWHVSWPCSFSAEPRPK
mmetsp:Transcript_31877/g.71781  ORF Transcript_31877/g.71781 Transcript_31877/m.71781 type:complete len:252 (+) Transcript_31877:346-1101(+)